MAEPARAHDLEPSEEAPSRHLEAVPTERTVEGVRVVPHAPVDESGLGRSAFLGGAIGFFVAAIGITIAGTVGGIGLGGSLAIGVFAGLFGGIGFGAMMGATIPLSRRLEGSHGRPVSSRGLDDASGPVAG
jgi:hypothetical protein